MFTFVYINSDVHLCKYVLEHILLHCVFGGLNIRAVHVLPELLKHSSLGLHNSVS